MREGTKNINGCHSLFLFAFSGTFTISFSLYTVCPGNSDPFYIVSYYINLVTTSWTYSISNTYIIFFIFNILDRIIMHIFYITLLRGRVTLESIDIFLDHEIKLQNFQVSWKLFYLYIFVETGKDGERSK